jgi:hypothetical protein
MRFTLRREDTRSLSQQAVKLQVENMKTERWRPVPEALVLAWYSALAVFASYESAQI